MTSPWDPVQYERFRDERSQPFFDLLNLVSPAPGGTAIDLGCGTGELTKLLHEKLRARETVGLDSSESMLAKSAAFAGDGLRFELGSITDFAPPAPVDVLFSNAALQWVDDHETVFPRLVGFVAPGGQVAIQMPDNDDFVTHAVAKEVALEEPFLSAMGGYIRSWPVRPPEWYAILLDRMGFGEQDVSLRIYGHQLDSRDGVVEWVKGTYLTGYEKRLSPELYLRYLERYRHRLFETVEDRRPFFYPYRRILIWGRKQGP
ncbi:MAG: trans-aconitate methyltransferase [Anaerolinea sp.]|nr:trans-aconitate methyltransferase [Anaerolinea sp.]